MAETDFDIDAAADEFDAGKDLPGDDVDPGEGGDDGGGADDLPPGFKSYEEYIADGGDPDQYVGRAAYVARYENIQENKALKRELKGVKETVQQTMDTVAEWQERERTKMREELEAELHEAKENEDPDAALAAKEKLDALDDATPPPRGDNREEHPVIQDFREANPIIDGESDQFDEEFNADVEGFYNALHAQLSMGGHKKLTDGQIKRCLRQALKSAQELHEIDEPAGGNDDADARGESPRNRRGRTGTRGRRGSRQQPAPRAEDFKIKDPRNPRQENAAAEVRDMIKDKYGDEAAKRFEANLAR